MLVTQFPAVFWNQWLWNSSDRIAMREQITSRVRQGDFCGLTIDYEPNRERRGCECICRSISLGQEETRKRSGPFHPSLCSALCWASGQVSTGVRNRVGLGSRQLLFPLLCLSVHGGSQHTTGKRFYPVGCRIGMGHLRYAIFAFEDKVAEAREAVKP